jgi:uncharacterized membrane protein required for colicin V production
LNSCVGLLSSIIGLFAAIKYYSSLAEWLNAKFFLLEQFEEFFAEHFILPTQISQINVGILSLPDMSAYLDKLSLPANLKIQLLEFILNLCDKFALAAGTTLGEVINLFLAEIIFKALLIFVIWFVVNKVALVFSRLLTNAIQGTLLGVVNKAGGLVTGLMMIALVMTILFGLLGPLLELARFSEPSFLIAVAKIISEAKFVQLFMAVYSIMMGELIVPWL